MVDAFFAAARGGDFDALVAVLDPRVVLRVDTGAVLAGAAVLAQGAEAVARQASAWGRVGLAIRRALVNGAAGLVSERDGKPFSVGAFTINKGRIVELDILADPVRVAALDLKLLDS